MHGQGLSGGQGLQGLCAPYFASIRGDRGVVGHILWFERGDA